MSTVLGCYALGLGWDFQEVRWVVGRGRGGWMVGGGRAEGAAGSAAGDSAPKFLARPFDQCRNTAKMVTFNE